MRYLGTGFTITLGGLRFRVRVDLDEMPEESEYRTMSEDAPAAAGRCEHDLGTTGRPPHHLRSRRA